MNHVINTRYSTAVCGAVGALALTLSATTPVAEGARCFSKIISVGDSLSDVGNFYSLTGGTQPPPPYFEGRFCDGPVWNEYLAGMLNMELKPENQYALGGSLTGDMNLNSVPPSFILPGLEQQIDQVIADGRRSRVDPRALYTVWAGANDFFAWVASGDPDPTPMITTGVTNTVEAIADLSEAGARYFVVFNLPDLGKTPTALGFGPVLSGTLSFLCDSYNQQLDQQLDALEASNRKLRIVRVDAYWLINHMVASPELYGFTNVTEPAVEGLPTADPDTYLFWDGVHPTTAAHEYVADAALQQLEKTFDGIHHHGWHVANFRGRVYGAAHRMNCMKELTVPSHPRSRRAR
ncbi:MAG: SGNH/GDSL hydrolase family protein [Haloferula sp.]